MASRLQHLILICLLGYFTISEGACPTFFTELIPGTCYYFSEEINNVQSWAGAQTYCKTFNGTDLIVIDTYEEFNAVTDFMTTNLYTDAYIGLSELPITPEQWVWVDGVTFPLESPLWDCTYPKLASLSDCAILDDVVETAMGVSQPRFRIRDSVCTSMLNFICEGPALAAKVSPVH